MSRRWIVGTVLALVLAGGWWSCSHQPEPPPPLPPAPIECGGPENLSDEEFERMAKTNPVDMLRAGLARYARDAKGFRATLEKQERVDGRLNDPEVIRIVAWGEAADPPADGPRVRMIWEKGAPGSFGTALTGVLFPAEGTTDTLVTYRQGAPLFPVKSLNVRDPMARGTSRYCVRDAGLYRGMLRTYTAWKDHQEAGDLTTEYLGKRPVAECADRVCHIV
ncbi:MAG TPA: DUF1571 domain-containing protein [Urbifossiella sp.]|jgi:hypothetical protein|nr:DUF1571 domain-containing protein [Urbifossiella sp.]